MPSLDYLCLGGVELSNSARTIAYACEGIKPHTMRVTDCSCPQLNKFLGDPAYTRPELDGAVWVDAARPESFEFGGLLITGIDGLDAAPVSRSITDRIGDGAVIGRRRLGPRTITVRGLLLGSSCCGIDYGMSWLSSALRGSLSCGTAGGCNGDDLEYMVCCPDCDCPDNDTDAEIMDCGADAFRTMKEVACTKEPVITGRVGGYCQCCRTCPAAQVEFTLTAGRPHALLPPVTVSDAVAWEVAPPTEDDCVTWSTAADCVSSGEASCAEEADNCMDTALAGIGCATTIPPDLPVPSNPCVCEPLTRGRMCLEIPSSVLTPIWSDVVPDIEIFAGANQLRSVRVRFYPNPVGFPSIDDLDECGFCAEINVSVIPAGATLHIDGTTRRVTVNCGGGVEAPAGGAVTGQDGGPYAWPVLDCGVPYIACFEADSATIAADATITVRVFSREN